MKGDVYGIAAEETVEAFRIVSTRRNGLERTARVLHVELREGPPAAGVEPRLAEIHMGISLCERPEQAAVAARRFPAIGGLIARVAMVSGHGFCWADTGPPGHLTAWGRPVQFAAGIVEISDADA